MGTTMLLGLSMFFIGMAMIVYAVYTGRRANASQLWEIATGELVSHEIIERRGKYGSRSYSLGVFYRYSVDGQAYESRRLCFGQYFWDGLSEVQLWLDQDAAGGKVEVFYDPKNPAAAVLLPGRAGAEGLALFLIIGAVLVLFSSVGMFAL